MKAIILISALFLSLICNAENETKLKSAVKKVTVFLNSAQVFRSSEFSVSSGLTNLIFEGVSPFLNAQSIQVSGKGDFVILDVQYRLKEAAYVQPELKPLPPKIIKDIEILKDSLNQLGFDLDVITNKKDVLATEKKVLLGNKFMQGKADTIPDLIQAMSYLRKQLNDINTIFNQVNRQEYKLLKEKTRMELRLTDLQNYNLHINPVIDEQQTYQVVVTVQANESISGNISINYMVENAGWTPTYDIRAKEAGLPVQLIQKANVSQSSGEDWKNVKITLSTITPDLGITKPFLSPIYLSYFNYLQDQYNRKDYNTLNKCRSEGASILDAEKSFGGAANTNIPALTSTQFSTVNQTMTNVEYEIDLPYTIPTDGKPHIIAVQETELKAEFVHYLVPRLNKQAYLVAKITDWGQLNLLSAPANIYFDGTFVGETQVNTGIMSDTLELSLGVDRSIIIERKKEKDQDKTAMIGSNNVKTIKYNLIIKNNKGTNSIVVIEDQMPLSQDAGIKIEKVNTSGADFNPETGQLTWRTKISSKQSKTISFSYTVEYDKNKPLANLF